MAYRDHTLFVLLASSFKTRLSGMFPLTAGRLSLGTSGSCASLQLTWSESSSSSFDSRSSVKSSWEDLSVRFYSGTSNSLAALSDASSEPAHSAVNVLTRRSFVAVAIASYNSCVYFGLTGSPRRGATRGMTEDMMNCRSVYSVQEGFAQEMIVTGRCNKASVGRVLEC